MKSENVKIKNKKKIIIKCITFAVILAILFTPMAKETYDDGGTVTYTSLTYKIVKWKKAVGFYNNKFSYYEKTSVFFIPNCYKKLDELWEMEQADNPGIYEGLTHGTSAE